MQTPAPVDYAKATSVADALAKLQQFGDEARVIAGGHSLLPMMKLRLARPDALVDLNDIPELTGIRVEGSEIVVGAMTRHAEILSSDILSEHYPIFREAEHMIADPIVRNRGTIGGSMCQADPSADLSAIGSALKGTAVIVGPGGTRTVALRDFHRGPYETVVEYGEILTEVRYPIRPGAMQEQIRQPAHQPHGPAHQSHALPEQDLQQLPPGVEPERWQHQRPDCPRQQTIDRDG